MKNKLLAMLMAAALAVSVVPTVAFAADCPHTQTAWYSSPDHPGDPTWEELLCEECWEVLDTRHNAPDPEPTPDPPVDPEPVKPVSPEIGSCPHTEKYGAPSGSFTHTWTCSGCGATLGEERCADNNGDTKCDICGFQVSSGKPEIGSCPHTEQTAYGTGVFGSHTFYCSSCGTELTTKPCTDGNQDGVCDICGATGLSSACEHKAATAYGEGHYGYHTWYCDSCDANMGESPCVYENHVCKYCGANEKTAAETEKPGGETPVTPTTPAAPTAPAKSAASSAKGLDAVPKTGDATIGVLGAFLLTLGGTALVPRKKRA